MKLLELNPLRIWSYYPRETVSREFLNKIRAKDKGWKGIPPVPVFEIPRSLRIFCKVDHDYLLMDGSTRREAANQLWLNVPSAVYEWGEEVLVEEHGLAPFAHSSDPRLYEKLINMYKVRDRLDILSRVLR